MALIPTTAAAVDYRRKIAMELMQQGMDGAPVRHWAQGLAKLGQGALGGYEMYQADQKDKADDIEGAKAYMALLQNAPGGAPAPVSAAPAPTPAPVPPASPAVPMAAPMGNKVVDALAPPPVTGPRPNGPVMPSAKVWGDAEAEAAGLYEPAAPNTKLASANPAAPIPAAPPAPSPVTQALAQSPQPSPAPQVMAQAEDPNRAKIIQLLSSDSPAARKMGKALADNYIAQQFKPETTDEIKEYNLAKKQGFSGSFFDFKTGLKKAGATQVNVDTKGENAFATKAGQLQAARYDELASDAQSSKQMLSDVATLNELGKNIQTGKLAEAKAAIGPYANALGIDVKGLSEIQAFEAIVNRVAPSLRVKGSGAQSDYELKNFLKSLPSLGNTPEGNEIATKTMEGLYQNKLAAAEIGSKALAREITPQQADKMLRELPDHMQNYREYLKKNTAASKPGGGADRSAVEQEMRRRGLLK